MKALFSNGSLAKSVGWLGAGLSAGAAGKQFGKYDALAAALGVLLTGWAIHNASNTSK